MHVTSLEECCAGGWGVRYPGLSYGEYPGSKFAKGGVLGQIDVVPSTFPTEPIRLPNGEYAIAQTQPTTPRVPMIVWILGAGALAFFFLGRGRR